MAANEVSFHHVPEKTGTSLQGAFKSRSLSSRVIFNSNLNQCLKNENKIFNGLNRDCQFFLLDAFLNFHFWSILIFTNELIFFSKIEFSSIFLVKYFVQKVKFTVQQFSFFIVKSQVLLYFPEIFTKQLKLTHHWASLVTFARGWIPQKTYFY